MFSHYFRRFGHGEARLIRLAMIPPDKGPRTPDEQPIDLESPKIQNKARNIDREVVRTLAGAVSESNDEQQRIMGIMQTQDSVRVQPIIAYDTPNGKPGVSYKVTVLDAGLPPKDWQKVLEQVSVEKTTGGWMFYASDIVTFDPLSENIGRKQQNMLDMTDDRVAELVGLGSQLEDDMVRFDIPNDPEVSLDISDRRIGEAITNIERTAWGPAGVTGENSVTSHINFIIDTYDIASPVGRMKVAETYLRELDSSTYNRLSLAQYEPKLSGSQVIMTKTSTPGRLPFTIPSLGGDESVSERRELPPNLVSAINDLQRDTLSPSSILNTGDNSINDHLRSLADEFKIVGKDNLRDLALAYLDALNRNFPDSFDTFSDRGYSVYSNDNRVVVTARTQESSPPPSEDEPPIPGPEPDLVPPPPPEVGEESDEAAPETVDYEKALAEGKNRIDKIVSLAKFDDGGIGTLSAMVDDLNSWIANNGYDVLGVDATKQLKDDLVQHLNDNTPERGIVANEGGEYFRVFYRRGQERFDVRDVTDKEVDKLPKYGEVLAAGKQQIDGVIQMLKADSGGLASMRGAVDNLNSWLEENSDGLMDFQAEDLREELAQHLNDNTPERGIVANEGGEYFRVFYRRGQERFDVRDVTDKEVDKLPKYGEVLAAGKQQIDGVIQMLKADSGGLASMRGAVDNLNSWLEENSDGLMDFQVEDLKEELLSHLLSSAPKGVVEGVAGEIFKVRLKNERFVVSDITKKVNERIDKINEKAVLDGKATIDSVFGGLTTVTGGPTEDADLSVLTDFIEEQPDEVDKGALRTAMLDHIEANHDYVRAENGEYFTIVPDGDGFKVEMLDSPYEMTLKEGQGQLDSIVAGIIPDSSGADIAQMSFDGLSDWIEEQDADTQDTLRADLLSYLDGKGNPIVKENGTELKVTLEGGRFKVADMVDVKQAEYEALLGKGKGGVDNILGRIKEADGGIDEVRGLMERLDAWIAGQPDDIDKAKLAQDLYDYIVATNGSDTVAGAAGDEFKIKLQPDGTFNAVDMVAKRERQAEKLNEQAIQGGKAEIDSLIGQLTAVEGGPSSLDASALTDFIDNQPDQVDKDALRRTMLDYINANHDYVRAENGEYFTIVPDGDGFKVEMLDSPYEKAIKEGTSRIDALATAIDNATSDMDGYRKSVFEINDWISDQADLTDDQRGELRTAMVKHFADTYRNPMYNESGNGFKVSESGGLIVIEQVDAVEETERMYNEALEAGKAKVATFNEEVKKTDAGSIAETLDTFENYIDGEFNEWLEGLDASVDKAKLASELLALVKPNPIENDGRTFRVYLENGKFEVSDITAEKKESSELKGQIDDMKEQIKDLQEKLKGFESKEAKLTDEDVAIMLAALLVALELVEKGDLAAANAKVEAALGRFGIEVDADGQLRIAPTFDQLRKETGEDSPESAEVMSQRELYNTTTSLYRMVSRIHFANNKYGEPNDILDVTKVPAPTALRLYLSLRAAKLDQKQLLDANQPLSKEQEAAAKRLIEQSRKYIAGEDVGAVEEWNSSVSLPGSSEPGPADKDIDAAIRNADEQLARIPSGAQNQFLDAVKGIDFNELNEAQRFVVAIVAIIAAIAMLIDKYYGSKLSKESDNEFVVSGKTEAAKRVDEALEEIDGDDEEEKLTTLKEKREEKLEEDEKELKGVNEDIEEKEDAITKLKDKIADLEKDEDKLDDDDKEELKEFKKELEAAEEELAELKEKREKLEEGIKATKEDIDEIDDRLEDLKEDDEKDEEDESDEEDEGAPERLLGFEKSKRAARAMEKLGLDIDLFDNLSTKFEDDSLMILDEDGEPVATVNFDDDGKVKGAVDKPSSSKFDEAVELAKSDAKKVEERTDAALKEVKIDAAKQKFITVTVSDDRSEVVVSTLGGDELATITFDDAGDIDTIDKNGKISEKIDDYAESLDDANKAKAMDAIADILGADFEFDDKVDLDAQLKTLAKELAEKGGKDDDDLYLKGNDLCSIKDDTVIISDFKTNLDGGKPERALLRLATKITSADFSDVEDKAADTFTELLKESIPKNGEWIDGEVVFGDDSSYEYKVDGDDNIYRRDAAGKYEIYSEKNGDWNAIAGGGRLI